MNFQIDTVSLFLSNRFNDIFKLIFVSPIKVCDKITDECITFDDSGSMCQIKCPDCETLTKLSTFTNQRTGKISFSLYNFSRHFEMHKSVDQDNLSIDSIDKNGESSKQSKVYFPNSSVSV